MALTKEACPNCGAPAQIPAGSSRFSCPYCATSLVVERQNGEIALAVADQISGSLEKTSAQTQAVIQTGTHVTQAELRRLQVAQDLSVAQMRLSNVQSEMRSLERMPPSPVTRRHMQELRAQEEALKQQITTLQDILNPPSPRTVAARAATTRAKSPAHGNLGWHLFGFRGRIGRGGFWGGIAVLFVLSLIIGAMIPPAAEPGAAAPEVSGPASLAVTVGTLLMLWIGLAIAVKRFHDRDKPGWWVLLGFIPVFGPIWLLIELGFLPGTPGANRYG